MAKKGKGNKGGLFKPPRWKYLAEIVTFESPEKAQKAARQLVREVKKAKRRDKALRIARALTYAANRAKASAKRGNLSPEKRRELREISKIYREAADEAWEIYHEKFSD